MSSSSSSSSAVGSAKLLLSIVVLIALTEVMMVSAARLPRLPIDGTESEQEDQPRHHRKQLTKEEIKQEMERQLLILQEAEENILQKIRELEAERKALNGRKRSHYNSMCMFNVVACYRKRK